jgi:hypothetical protein
MCCSLDFAASQSLMHVKASTVSGLSLRHRSSMILPVVLKVAYEEMVETGTLKTSLARVERTG